MTDNRTTETVAALYVQASGCYFGLEGVDPWDKARDARQYAGPHSVVAHPPCERWGRYWHGGPSARVRRIRGDDGGCFAAALEAVRKWGGVLEHPEASYAWHHFGLNAPPRDGGWITADFVGGWTCCVEQGHYGHRARKATWLYACHAGLPSSPGARVVSVSDWTRATAPPRSGAAPCVLASASGSRPDSAPPHPFHSATCCFPWRGRSTEKGSQHERSGLTVS